MLDWLKGHSMPLSAVVGLFAAFVWGYLWLYSEFVTAGQFVSYQIGIEARILLEKRQALEAELLKVEVKCRAYPQRCDAVDKALAERYRRDLRRVEADLLNVQNQAKQRR